MHTLPTLTTARLTLRPFTLADAPHVQKLAGEKAIAATTYALPHPYEDGMAEEWIKTHHAAFEAMTGVHLAMTHSESHDVIGAISLMKINQQDAHAELGYWVGVPYWGQGFCTESARAVLAYGFDELPLNRIYAFHFVNNPASGRVMQKIGMTHEGRQRQHICKWGEYIDVELYGMLNNDPRP